MNRTLLKSLCLAGFAALGVAWLPACGGDGNKADSGSNMDMGTSADMTTAPPKPDPLYLSNENCVSQPDPKGVKPTCEAADFSCNGHYTDPTEAAPEDATETGLIKDFQDSNKVVGAVVKIYLTTQDVLDDKPATQSEPSDENGNYTVDIPKGATRIIRGVVGGKAVSSATMSDTIPSYEFGVPWNDPAPVSVTVKTKQAIPGLVSVAQQDGLGILAGGVHDCNDKETGGGQATVTVEGKDYDGGPNIFYFKYIGGDPLPVRTQKWTEAGGVFAALNVPPGTGHATVKGIIGSGDLQVIGDDAIPVIADAVTIIHMMPLATPAQ